MLSGRRDLIETPCGAIVQYPHTTVTEQTLTLSAERNCNLTQSPIENPERPSAPSPEQTERATSGMSKDEGRRRQLVIGKSASITVPSGQMIEDPFIHSRTSTATNTEARRFETTSQNKR